MGSTLDRVVIAILAAGRSSRMGAPKALVELDGAPALERVRSIARRAGLDARVVLGFHEAAIRARVPLAEEEVLVNREPERGQSSSVRLAARSLAPDESIVLWPVDHARVAESTFRLLLDRFRARPGGIEIVVPSRGGRRGHPLLAAPAIVRELAELDDDQPAHVVVRRVPSRVLHVPVEDAMVLADFDRPEDLEPPP